jgi:putative ABC transport system substrate-binding protein
MHSDLLKRREFITLLGGAAAAWPFAARSQHGERMRRIGMLTSLAADDPESMARMAAFLQELQQLGWTNRRNVQIDFRWAPGGAESIRKYTAELVALAPDVILASGGTVVGPLLQATRTIPIVFTQTTDPVGAGLVATLGRPGGNATGFTPFEYGMSGKWLELLKEVVPSLKRVAVLRDPAQPLGIGQFAVIQSVAQPFGVEVSSIDARHSDDIEPALVAFARSSNGGLIVPASGPTLVHRELIISLLSRNKLPAVYSQRAFIISGGLMSYGSDTIDPYRRAAGYVDRILKGEKPADLPVQAPTRYELVINLKTAKALGLDLPPMLLARADEVIE